MSNKKDRLFEFRIFDSNAEFKFIYYKFLFLKIDILIEMNAKCYILTEEPIRIPVATTEPKTTARKTVCIHI